MRAEYTSRPLPVGTDRCRCSACGCHFTSSAAFDEHRVGRHGERGCLSADEMDARGMRVALGWRTTSKPSRYAPARGAGAAIDSDPHPEAGR